MSPAAMMLLVVLWEQWISYAVTYQAGLSALQRVGYKSMWGRESDMNR